MSIIVDFVTIKLIEEVSQEYTQLGKISDGLLSALNCIFGQPLLSALDLFDRNAVQHIYTSLGKEIYKVCSNSGQEYVCPSSLQFCPCLSFSFGVARRGELVMCKHLLAIHLCKACQSCVELEVSEEEFSTLCQLSMDPSLVFLVFLLFFAAWFQLSIYSFSFNVVASFLTVLVLLYFAVVGRLLFPFEKILLVLFYKEPIKSPRKSYFEKQLSLDKIAFDDEITRKLRELTGHIVRDFILAWYNTVSDDVHFVQEAFELFEHVFTCLRTKVSAVDPELFLSSLLRFLSRHLSCYQRAVRYADDVASRDPERRRQLVIITYEKLLGHLAMSNYPDTEVDHLRSLTAVLLKTLLPTDYRLTGAGLYVVRELISKNVFVPLIDLLSAPSWINRTIVHILREERAPNPDGDSVYDLDGSLTSSDYEDVSDSSSSSSDADLEGVEIMDLLEVSHTKPEKDLKVVFSVAENTDDLNLDISYDPTATPAVDVRQSTPRSSASGISLISYTVEEGFASADRKRSGAGRSSDVGLNGVVRGQTDHSMDLNCFAGDDQTSVTESNGDATMESLNGSASSVEDERLFRRLRIAKVMTMEEPFEKGSKYTLYIVEYSTPAVPPKPRFLRSSSRPFFTNNQEKSEVTTSEGGSGPRLLHHQVKRRFREFLNLQERLGENLVIRRLMRNVKGPSRMFPMPIGNMDKDYIEKRRKFLQAYLRELCSIPHINKCATMKEFLAYNSDPRIAFVRKQSQYIPRFDKMLKNVVQDMFGAATDHITGRLGRCDEPEPPSEERSSPPSVVNPISLKRLSLAPPPDIFDHPMFNAAQKTLRENPVTKFKNIFLGKRPDTAIYEEGLRDYRPFSGPRNPNQTEFGRKWRTPDNLLSNRSLFHDVMRQGRRTQGDGCDQVYDVKEGLCGVKDDLITGSIFRLVYQIWGVNVGTNSFLYLCLGRYTKKFIDLRVEMLTKKDQWLFYLKSLQQALWPEGVWGGKGEEDGASEEDKYEEASRVLEDTFPDALRYVVGRCRYDSGVSGLLDSFQDPVVNRHVVYHLLDHVMKFLFPNLPSVISSATNVSL